MTQDKVTPETDEWRSRLVSDPQGISRILDDVHRVAVVGIKTDPPGGPAHYVPEHMQHAGYEIVPVPVYFPEATEILGEPVQRSLATIEPPVDMVVLFRRSADVPKHVDEILAARPKVVWMQLGIANDAAAETFAKAGMRVVQNHCALIELKRRGR